MDVKPGNVFVNYSLERFVVGDFDSAQFLGMKVEGKNGTPMWTMIKSRRSTVVSEELDFHGLRLIKQWVRGKGNGGPEIGVKYPGTWALLQAPVYTSDGVAIRVREDDEQKREGIR